MGAARDSVSIFCMKNLLLLISITFLLTSCKTNIVDRYDCAGKEQLLADTLVKCIKESKEEPSTQPSIKQNPIHACGDVTKTLICTPVYKEFSL